MQKILKTQKRVYHPKLEPCPEQEKVYRWLRKQKKPKTLKEVADGVGKTTNQTWPLLDRLRNDYKGLVGKTTDGKYFAHRQ